MKEKIRVALIYHKNSKFLSGKHFDNTYYNFFIKAWKRNSSLDVTYFPTDNKFDVFGTGTRVNSSFLIVETEPVTFIFS